MDEDRREKFKEMLGRVQVERRQVGEEWKEGKRNKVLKELEGQEGSSWVKRKGWWDEECKESNKEVRKELRKWRRMGGYI